MHEMKFILFKKNLIHELKCFQASRAQILKKASDYIAFVMNRISSHEADISDLKKQNDILVDQGQCILS